MVHRLNSKPQPCGFALVVALLLLVAMSFIGIAALRNVSLQEKMTGNTYFKLISFQEADAGMRSAEQLMHVIFGSSTQPIPAQDGNSVWKTRDDNGAGAAYWTSSGALTYSQSMTPLSYTGTSIIVTTEDVSGVPVTPYACSNSAAGSNIGTGALEATQPCQVRPVRETAVSTDSVTGARSVVQQYFNYRSE